MIEKINGEHARIIIQLNNCSSLGEIAATDDLFWSDLYLKIDSAGWWWLYDANQDNYYPLTDYSFDYIQDIIDGKKVTLQALELTEEEITDYFDEGE